MARGKYYGERELLSDPGDEAVAVTADGNDFDEPAKFIYVGTGGDLKMKGAGDTDWVTWKAVPSGATIPFRAVAVHADSTADDILAIY
jgi:hypothetical protein